MGEGQVSILNEGNAQELAWVHGKAAFRDHSECTHISLNVAALNKRTRTSFSEKREGEFGLRKCWQVDNLFPH